jgi:phosphoglycerate dehydrogenase-like enzyme
MLRIAILDDYHDVALKMADWSVLRDRCEITVFNHAFRDEDEAAGALAPFDILCTMRERTRMPASLIARLPALKLITITGARNRTLDLVASAARGIVVSGTGRRGHGHLATPELAWGLILSLARHIPHEAARMREGGWQTTMGHVLAGKTLGLMGIGRLGSRMVPVARAFDMDVIAWSPNLTPERAAASGAVHVAKDELLRRSDVLSLHLVLAETTRGIIGASELALMKPSAYLINTARAPLVDEAALTDVLRSGAIAGAGLDVHYREPMPDDDPFRTLPNVVLTPHLGFTVEELFRVFYEDTVENIAAFLDGAPIRLLTPGQ